MPAEEEIYTSFIYLINKQVESISFLLLFNPKTLIKVPLCVGLQTGSLTRRAGKTEKKRQTIPDW